MIILVVLGTIGSLLAAGWAQKALLARSVPLNLPAYCERTGERLHISARHWGVLGLMIPLADSHWQVDCITFASDTPIIRVDLFRCETTIIHAFRATERKPWIGCPLIQMLTGVPQMETGLASRYP